MGPERFRSGQARRAPGWTLPELLMAVGLVLALAAWVSRGEAEARARQSLQAASQRVVGGLEDARASAMREGQPCGLALGVTGWREPQGGGLPACRLLEQELAAGVEVSHNLPDPVRFSANGLVVDGGTVWLRSPGTPVVRCVVVSLPLGITRVGREGPGGCEPEQIL